MATIAQAARHIVLSERRFSELLNQGVLTRADRGGYDLDAVREEYIGHLREIAAGRRGGGDLDPTAERARKDKELADNTALKNAKMRGELLDRAEVHQALTASFARVRARLLAMPSKLAPLLVGMAAIAAVQEKVSNAVNEALAELAATNVAGVPASDGEQEDA